MNRPVHHFPCRLATRKPLSLFGLLHANHYKYEPDTVSRVQVMSARPLGVLSDAGYLPAAALPGHLHAPERAPLPVSADLPRCETNQALNQRFGIWLAVRASNLTHLVAAFPRFSYILAGACRA